MSDAGAFIEAALSQFLMKPSHGLANPEQDNLTCRLCHGSQNRFDTESTASNSEFAVVKCKDTNKSLDTQEGGVKAPWVRYYAS